MRKSGLLLQGTELEFESGPAEEVTDLAGVVPLVEPSRGSGVFEKDDRVLAARKNPKALGRAQMVELFVTLSALGGECVEDFETLRVDPGLSATLGYELPAPSNACSFLEWFSDKVAVTEPPLQGASYRGNRLDRRP